MVRSPAARFHVHPQIATLLGEGYRSSEVALKELVDNAWDADATTVSITLPEAMTAAPIIITDNGSGMTRAEVEQDYLQIAHGRQSRKGSHTLGLQRVVKGRKGIGKFAGLMAADDMEIETRARGVRTSLRIRKEDLPTAPDIEALDLPVESEPCDAEDHGTAVRLSNLSQALAFPSPDRLKRLLVLDYGRQDRFAITVNGESIGIDDIPGETFSAEADLPGVGPVRLNFTISDGKKPLKQHGIALRVGGRLVGDPVFLGLDHDEEIPAKLLRKVYGELEANGLESSVTADFGTLVENSLAYAAVEGWASGQLKKALGRVFANEVSLARARRTQEINRRLSLLPEYKRQFAEVAVERAIAKYYTDKEDKLDVVVSSTLDAIEYDPYFDIVKAVQEAPVHEVERFAAVLDNFGLADMGRMAVQAQHRLSILDQLDALLLNSDTLEADMHRALEHNLWVLGSEYALLSSNQTTKVILAKYADVHFDGPRANKRPDLLLCASVTERHVLIEFKRPSHAITRDDENQAVKYRDDLRTTFDNVELLLIGLGTAPGVDSGSRAPKLQVRSYAQIVTRARTELEWLLKQLKEELAPAQALA